MGRSTSSRHNQKKLNYENRYNQKKLNFETLRYYYCNAHSFWNKRNEYQRLLATLEFDVICLTETWLNSEKTNGTFCPKEYRVFRKDRNSNGGGVALFAKRELQTSAVSLDNRYSDLEILAVDFAGQNALRVITVYRPPKCSSETSNNIWRCLSELANSGKPSIVIGDFNMREIVWSPNILYPQNSEMNANFVHKMNQAGLQQYVTQPTRKDLNSGTENFLDLVFCTDDAFIFDVEVVQPIVHSDHSAITLTSTGPKSSNNGENTEEFRDYAKADWAIINEFLQQINWDLTFQNCVTSEDHWNAFLEILKIAIDEFVPLTKSKLGNKKIHPKYLKDLIKKKKELYYQRENQSLKEKYNKLNEKIRKITNNIAKKRENKILSSADPNRLFKYVRKRRCNDNGVGPLKDKNGKLSTDETVKSNILNDCFVRNFTVDNGNIPVFDSRVPNDIHLEDSLNFTPAKVRQCLSKISGKKSRTPDGVPAIFYKMTANHISYPLSVIFNVSFATGILPEIWKVADVVPLFKKGDSTDPNNYRPVSLTCIACKIMEMCIADEIFNYLRASNLLSPQQHGFLSRRSTCTQLLECFEDWTSNLENKEPTDVIYVDFKKAFDSVSHEKLLAKLEAYGLKGNLLSWIKNFLTGRTQRVCLGKSNSEYAFVTSGVPQGSVLGPLLFLIFVNDLPDQFVDVISKLFADDLKLYQVARMFESIKTALKELDLWADKWQLNIAVPKCNALHIDERRNGNAEYTLQGNVLPSEPCIRDLGVYVSNDLKVSDHCFEITKKANKITNMIFNCFETDSLYVLLDAYKIYVRPLLEYCTPVWNPHLIKDITLIEKVQKYYTRRLYKRCGLTKQPYPERLKFLGLESLEKRRLYFDLCMVYTILHNENDLKVNDFFIRAPSRTNLNRGHHMKLKVNTVQSNIRMNFFSLRAAKIWNWLPKFVPGTKEPIVNAMNIKLFKTRIAKLNFSDFLNFS